MQPFFSIIIPVYNVAPYLRECLDSVLAQTFCEWEAICVDDGSTDGSDAILDEYAAKDDRFRVVHQANSGVSVARNKAIENAIGSWVTFVDGDDRIDTTRLQRIKKIIDDVKNVEWIHETQYVSNLQGREAPQYSDRVEFVTGDGAYLIGWTVLQKNALLVLNSYRLESVAKLKFIEGMRYAEDDIYELCALKYCKAFAVTGCCGYWYREDRVDAASRHINVDDSIRVQEALLDLPRQQKAIIKELHGLESFRAIYTKTVWKDFNRVFRKLRTASRESKERYRRLTVQMYSSECFDVTRLSGYIPGYVIYAKTGFVWPLLINDLIVRVARKIVSNCIR